MYSATTLQDARALLDAARPADISIVRTPAATVIVVAQAPVAELPPLLDLDAAATAAHVSVRTLRDAIRAGKLKASGTSRTRVVAREALLAWIDSRRVRVQSPNDALEQRANQLAEAE